MILLIRFILVSLIVYLIVRAFTQYGREEEEPLQRPQSPQNNLKESKKISKEIGEVIDYEEVDK